MYEGEEDRQEKVCRAGKVVKIEEKKEERKKEDQNKRDCQLEDRDRKKVKIKKSLTKVEMARIRPTKQEC